MNEQVINPDFDNDYVTICLKMVSGEEIIAQVDPKMFNDPKQSSLVLYDPFRIEFRNNMALFTYWIVSSDENVIVIDKSDIMIRSVPHMRFQDQYTKIITEKYNQDDYEDDFLEGYNHTIINKGTDSIN